VEGGRVREKEVYKMRKGMEGGRLKKKEGRGRGIVWMVEG
jgi:hypothetical protein